MKAIFKQSETKQLQSDLKKATTQSDANAHITRYMVSQRAKGKKPEPEMQSRAYDAVDKSGNPLARAAWFERENAQRAAPQAPLAQTFASSSRPTPVPEFRAESNQNVAVLEAPLTLRPAATVGSTNNTDFAANVRSSGLEPDLAEGLIAEGAKRIKSALKGVDMIFAPDRSGSTSGTIERNITRISCVLQAASQAFDHDGSTVYLISSDHSEPIDGVQSVEEMRQALSAAPVGGGTPMARTAKTIFADMFNEWEINQSLSEDARKTLKPKTIVIPCDGVPSEDWELHAGRATAEGVTIDGALAPENALVAGRLGSSNRIVNGKPTRDSKLFKDVLVDASSVDEAFRPTLEAETRAWARENGFSQSYVQGKIVTQERDNGTPVAQNTLHGSVLVRVPVDLEEVIVDAVNKAKELGMPQTHFGLLLWLEGNEPGADEWFQHLDNNLKSRCGRDVVAYVKAGPELTVPALIKALCGARNQREAAKQV